MAILLNLVESSADDYDELAFVRDTHQQDWSRRMLRMLPTIHLCTIPRHFEYLN